MQSFQVERVIADVAQAKNDLARLSGIAPERLARCEKSVNDLETAAAHTLAQSWIPTNAEDLALSIRFVNENIRRVRSRIDDVLPDVVDGGQLDEYLRLSVAFAQALLLELRKENYDGRACENDGRERRGRARIGELNDRSKRTDEQTEFPATKSCKPGTTRRGTRGR